MKRYVFYIIDTLFDAMSSIDLPEELANNVPEASWFKITIESLGRGVFREVAEGCATLIATGKLWEHVQWLGVNVSYLRRVAVELTGDSLAGAKYEAALVVTACLNRALGDVRPSVFLLPLF
jgi:hypothetical protein